MVFIRFPFQNSTKCVFGDQVADSSKIHTFIRSYLGSDDFRIYCNGKELFQGQEVFPDATVHVTFSLPGGKGGFGSMLRAIGAQIEKTTNREACRDLSGRRLRDINEEQRLKKWISKESEREEQKLRRRKERIERLKAKPRHNFVDFGYEKAISELPERIDNALTAGMEKAAKRPIEEGESSKTSSSKKKCLWLDEDISDSSASDSESCGKATTSKDTACSSSSVQKENMFEILSSEASGGKTSNCSTYCEQQPKSELQPVVQEQVLLNEKDVSTSKDDSTFVIENQKVSLPLQEDMQCNVDFSVTSSKEDSTSAIENQVVSLPLQKDMQCNVDFSDTSSKEDSRSATENQVVSPSLQKDVQGKVNSDETSSQETQNAEDDSPIDILSFDSQAELEGLGLNRLKVALMARGLKCGGSISDRANRLWKIRGLQPQEYPKNLLAKSKK